MKVIALKAVLALCPLAQHVGTTTDGTQTYGRHILIDQAEIRPYSAELRKFVILHECGHMHQNPSEVGADTWAFKHMRVSKATLDTFCKIMGSKSSRCSNLRGLYERNR